MRNNGWSRYELLRAAQEIYKQQRELGEPKKGSLEQITLTNVASRVLEEESSLVREEDLDRVGWDITSAFQEERDDVRRRTGIDFTASQILRMRVFEEVEGRCLVTHAENVSEVYGPEVEFSYNDFIRGIELPLELGAEEAFLLGAYSARGHYGSKYSFHLQGTSSDHAFFDSLSGLVNKIYGLAVTPFRFEREGGTSRPRIDINSKAHKTWLIRNIGMTEENTQQAVNFAELEEYLEEDIEILEEAFLYGVIAARGVIYIPKDRDSLFVHINTSNTKYLEEIKELAKGLGYNPSIIGPEKRRLTFKTRSVHSMLESDFFESRPELFRFESDALFDYRGAFVHPEHIAKLS